MHIKALLCDGQVSASVLSLAETSENDGPGMRIVIFFQGCGIGCEWSHSPHLQPSESPLIFNESLCIMCLRCGQICEHAIHTFSDNVHLINRDLCTLCGKCVEACPESSEQRSGGALYIPGIKVDVKSMFDQIKPYADMCEGITLSGGEPLLQIDVALLLLQLCKGQKSDHSSNVYAKGRDIVKNFLGIETKQDMEKYEVFYVNSTTEGMNKLASALINSPNDLVLTTLMEHHANDLPWRERARTVYAEVDENGRLIEEDFERLLYEYRGRIKYVTVTAASNVIGYVNNIHKIAAVAHKYGAQIVAHRKFSMLGEIEDENIDFFVFSAHKMYSPFGGGAVVGLKKELDRRIPKFFGEGMVDAVNDNSVYYSWSPDRYEAGSPNYPGVVGMLRTIKFLKDEVGFDYVEKHEQKLLRKAIDDLKNIPAVIMYGDLEDISDRVGILVFNIKNKKNEDVASYLAGQAAIAVRHAKFCAHTYVNRLLGLDSISNSEEGCMTHEGMVRVSFGIYSEEKDVDALVSTIEKMLRDDNIMLRASDMAEPVRNFLNDRG